MLVIGLVYITRGGQNRQVWADALVDRGMFAHSRNPLYVANLLLFLGLAIVHNGWAMYLIVLPFFVVAYVCIVAAEGVSGRTIRRCLRRLPSPRAEMDAVAARALQCTAQHGVRLAEGPAQGIRDAVRLDQRSAAARVGARRRRAAPPIGRVELRIIMAIWIVDRVAYLIVRTLKLSGRLGTYNQSGTTWCPT